MLGNKGDDTAVSSVCKAQTSGGGPGEVLPIRGEEGVVQGSVFRVQQTA